MGKRPRDPNQLGKLIANIATGDVEDEVSEKKKRVKLRGRAGGVVGGKKRARKLTPEERSEIARIAANARWKKE